MKLHLHISLLSLALCGFWTNATASSGDPLSASAHVSLVPDSSGPAGDSTAPLSNTPSAVSDSTRTALNPVNVGPPGSVNDEEDTTDEEELPASDLYDDWDTTEVHAEKFDALTFDDTVRIPLVDPAHTAYVHPFDGPITSGFGFRRYRYHFGMDIDLNTGDSVHCAFDGKVRIAHRSRSYGYVVVVRHDNGLETYYAHLSRLLVHPGEDVQAGTIIGLGGSTGHSTGSHLHFEVRFRGQPINPNYIIDFQKMQLRCDTYNLTKSDFKYLSEMHKVHHYSRRRKRSWVTYYTPGGSYYATPHARAVMAKVPYPLIPGTDSVITNDYHNITGREQPADNQTPVARETPVTVKKTPATTSAHHPPSKTYTAQSSAATWHTVRSGDTLYAIALRNHTTVSRLCALNGIRSNSVLRLGERIRVR